MTITYIDGYKTDHRRQYPEGTTLVYSNWTPRKSRISYIDRVTLFGLQYFMEEYLIRKFNEDFFQKSRDEAVHSYGKLMDSYLGPGAISTEHIESLYDLGYVPIEIRSVMEGEEVPIGVPMLTLHNTVPEFFWMTNYLETIMSCILWQPCTSATLAKYFRRMLNRHCEKTNPEAHDFVPWQGHDFSFRGMSSFESACLSGAGHLLSFTGTDTIPAIQFLEKYYEADSSKELIGGSVSASEHSCMSLGQPGNEFQTFKRFITELYPKGIVSIVSDTWNLWQVVTDFLPRLKNEILARDGKLVIRPDCYDDKTEILTDSGWKFFEKLTDLDLVAEVSEDNSSFSFVKPKRIIKENYIGEMYHIHDFYKKINLVVTPNHNIITQKFDNSERIVKAEKYKPGSDKFSKIRIPKFGIQNNVTTKLSQHEKLLIAIQADGYLGKNYLKKRNHSIIFNFQKERKTNRLISILQSLNYEFTVEKPKSRMGQSTIRIKIPLKETISKTFDWVNPYTRDANWCREFLEELKHWDSTIRTPERFKYNTTIKENIDVVYNICIRAGKSVYITKSSDNRKEIFSDIYTAHINNNTLSGGQSIKKEKIQYNGIVYCVEVNSGKILVRRGMNGICVSGNSSRTGPEDIICGTPAASRTWSYSNSDWNKAEEQGLIQCLWNTFGGTTSSTGYKVLDSHISAIYGDAINYERANNICERLAARGFASTNLVYGVGSYTYQYNTRDTFGFAMKATYGVVNGEPRSIFKDPITDSGEKKSACGLIQLGKDFKGDYMLLDNQSTANGGYLKPVFRDGKILQSVTLNQVRKNVCR